MSSQRGEIIELKKRFHDKNVYKDHEKQYRLLSQIIDLMTTGFDVSRLFNEIILCVNTTDVRNKKMIYFYITNYATTHPKEALLIINTLVKECNDPSPIIRGLALRNLSELKIKNIEEHLVPLIKAGLNDPNGYVRRVAVFTVLKYHNLRKIKIKENFVDRLYQMIKDEDTSVVVNCLNVLDEIEKPLKITKKMIFYLLNRIRQFNSWQVCGILKYLKRYEPESKKEIFDIMNLLDSKLQCDRPSVVIGIMEIFLLFTESLPKIHLKVYSRLKEPLLLLYASNSNEVAYVLLKHIKLICFRCPEIFYNDYKDFFLYYEDPHYLKLAKLEILVKVVNENNLKDILNELICYIQSYDEIIGKKSISVLGDICVKFSENEIVELILSFIVDLFDLPFGYIISEIFAILKNILRKYSNEDFIETYIPNFCKFWELAETDDAQISMLWILGEYAKFLPKAPYIIENFIDNFEKYSNLVQHQILTSAMVLFFKKPPEMQKMLGRLLKMATEDDNQDIDIAERALYFYSLLKMDVNAAGNIILREKELISNYSEEYTPEFIDKLFSEFNSISVILEKSSSEFLKNVHVKVLGKIVDDDEDEEEGEFEEEEPEKEEKEIKKKVEIKKEEKSVTSGLLLQTDFEEVAPRKVIPKRIAPKFSLKRIPEKINQKKYQQIWMKSAPGINLNIKTKSKIIKISDIENVLSVNGIKSLAKSPVMLYLYSQSSLSNSYFLVQLKLEKNKQLIKSNVRTGKKKEIEIFLKLYRKLLSNL